jgi:threonine/homoserine/homoserine lactone efflux protein
LPIVILAAAITTVLAGIWLLLITSNGLDPDLLFNESRLGYTVGGVAAILTLGVGALYVFPRTRIVERTLGQLIAEARPPTPDEQQTLARAGSESRRAGWIVLAGLTIAAASMATASLWGLVL